MAGTRKPSRSQLRERALQAAAQTEVPASCDVVVMGCGASGLAAAITAANAGAGVVALDGTPEVARTILATGNGRCNLTNEALATSGYPDHYNDPSFVRAIMGEDPLSSILELMDRCGLACTVEDGRYYPASECAASVRDCLMRRAASLGVILAPARRVAHIADHNGRYLVTYVAECSGFETRCISAASVIIATGGPRGDEGPWDGLGMAETGPSPVLCPLECTPPDGLDLDAMNGARANCRVATGDWDETGQVLFRDYGLSGICVFDASRRVEPRDIVTLDLAPDLTEGEVRASLETVGSLAGILAPDLSDAILALARHDGCDAATLVKRLPFTVVGPADTDHAQVMRGGLATDGFDENLEAHGHPGLFACGEALDVDADCGGFNLSWAWTSGMACGEAAARHADMMGRVE